MIEPVPGPGTAACTLPYPDRFHQAVEFVNSPPPGANPLTDELSLVFYGLERQATVGPCKDPKPWGWGAEGAKWTAWTQHGDRPAVEAMRHFVRILEEEHQPDWWALKLAASQNPQPNGTAQPIIEPASATDNTTNGHAETPPAGSGLAGGEVGVWAAPQVREAAGGRRPHPRYEHAVATLNSKLYVVGGNSGGRYLSDVWVLDLAALTWTAASPSAAAGESHAPPPPSSEPATQPPPPPPPFPPTAAHVLLPWQGNLLSIGGHTKAKDGVKETELVVRVYDTRASVWSVLSLSGDAPSARGGHSATLVGSKVYIFGGEDAARRPQGDLHILDLNEMAWQPMEASGSAPSARAAHCAAVYQGRHLLVFGGGSVAHCFNDLHCLDTQTCEWWRPEVLGTPPSPRAGHAGDILGDSWYLVGGGNNTSGCSDMLALDLAALSGGGPLTWRQVAEVEPRAPIASEGLSLTAIPASSLLLAFGGYNGKYHNSVHVFAPGKSDAPEEKPSEAELDVKASVPSPPPAAEAEPAPAKEPVPAEPPLARVPSSSNAAYPSEASASRVSELEYARRQAETATQEAAAAKEAAAHELALMRRQLSSAQSAQATAEKEAEEARAALQVEQGKAFKLEVEVAELCKALERIPELERELERYHQLEADARAAKGKPAGLWGYIAGS